jgi:hypothetical protein
MGVGAMLPEIQKKGVEAFSLHAELPTVFGRYLLLKRLSRGGMGEIFLAKIGEIEGFEKLVIIKKILPNLVENQDFIARFIDEAQVAIKLNHANIAPVYEVGRVSGEYFLAIEYVEGRDLRRLIQRCREMGRRVPPDLCLYIVRELVAGLAYAHRRTDSKGTPLSLVHCDISPPNVMVSFEGEVKVIDFGIARSALRTAGSNPNMGFGKFGYMAPEQLLRGGEIDRRTDIYAAGVVLYELLTGERLYQFPEGSDYRLIARTVCQGRFAPPSRRDSGLDPSLDPIVCRALATQKDDRYQNAEEFRDALQQKLYQLNPTISTDSLAHFMSGLFGADRERERQELAEMRAVDVGAYQEELAGSATHTVTFARAGVGQRLTGLLSAAVTPRKDPSEARAVEATPTLDTDLARRPAPPSRVWTYVAGGAVVLLALGGAVWLSRRDSGVSVVSLPGPGPGGDRAAGAPRPVVEALPAPPVEEKPRPALRPAPPRRVANGRPKVEKEKEKPEPVVVDEGAKAAALQQSVEAKFKQVGQEYAQFKKGFGAQLEDKWQQVLQEVALRRYQHVDEMLNQLRKDMARIRNGPG